MLNKRKDWRMGPILPMLSDRTEQSGSAKGHYFHQDLLVARRIYQRNPRRHIDVGSRVDGFVAHVASFRQIEVVDIRPLHTRIPNIKYLQMDLMESPPVERTRICDSLSCLHALEHFGLGRYGDPLDPDGYKSGLAHLVQILEPGGLLYLSVPMGLQRVEFNAHRVFSASHLLELFADQKLSVTAFSYVDDAGELHEDEPLTPATINSMDNLKYGCGIFELRAPSAPPSAAPCAGHNANAAG